MTEAARAENRFDVKPGMNRLLGTLLALSVLLNVVLLLRPAPAPRAQERTKIVRETVVEERPVPVPVPAPPPTVRAEESTGSLLGPRRTTPPPPPPLGTITLMASPTTVSAGDPIVVTWTSSTEREGGEDWIGTYLPDAENGAYGEWKPAGKGRHGQVTIAAPDVPGAYEFRYLLDGGYVSVAASNLVTVIGTPGHYTVDAGATVVRPGAPLTAHYAAHAGKRTAQDWIGLYVSGAKSNSYASWQYVRDPASGTLAFTAPETPGLYEFRYLLNNGYRAMAVSLPFTVLP